MTSTAGPVRTRVDRDASTRTAPAPCVWLLGGVDPSGGSGLLRDAWAITEFGRERGPVISAPIATCLTLQGDGAPARAFEVRSDWLRAAIARAPHPAAIKIGAVGPGAARLLVEVLADLGAVSIFDPVWRASDGGVLAADLAATVELARACSLVTPNLAEARAMLGAIGEGEICGQWRDLAALERCAQRLAHALGTKVLLKGGPSEGGGLVADVLATGASTRAFVRARVPGPDPRGTGCALASAIAALVAMQPPSGPSEPRGAQASPSSTPSAGTSASLAADLDWAGAVAHALAWLDAARGHTHPGPDGRPHLGRL